MPFGFNRALAQFRRELLRAADQFGSGRDVTRRSGRPQFG
jgi:hypothetical protein